MIHFQCTEKEFKEIESPLVVWLDQIKDYPFAKNYWQRMGHELPREIWDEAHIRFGYQYAGIVIENRIISLAAVWKFSEKAWEVAAVSTDEGFRKQGYSKQVISFVTTFILREGRTATCGAMEDNFAMISNAKSVGFEVVPEDEVWWKFPSF